MRVAPSTFHELISEQRRGVRASLLRGMLRVAEVPYTWAVGWRNRRFDRQTVDIYRPPIPTISVGNLTTGGTGKTPMVAWLARWFRRHNVRAVVISRGYGAEKGSQNDEARELEQCLPDVPHLQNPDRAAASQVAIEELESQLIILDDGFQHRRIARDLDLVLLDALEPFGYGHVLPRGTLREPLHGLSRADMVALSRADLVDDERRERIRRQVNQYAPDAAWLELAHQPCELRSADGQTASAEMLAGKPVAAFCGIGNPTGFVRTLTACGYDVIGFREFPDHHPYRRSDVEDLATWVDSLPAVQAVICTHKDLVKIELAQLGRHALWALGIDVKILHGRDAFEAQLQQLANRITPNE